MNYVAIPENESVHQKVSSEWMSSTSRFAMGAEPSHHSSGQQANDKKCNAIIMSQTSKSCSRRSIDHIKYGFRKLRIYGGLRRVFTMKERSKEIRGEVFYSTNIEKGNGICKKNMGKTHAFSLSLVSFTVGTWREGRLSSGGPPSK